MRSIRLGDVCDPSKVAGLETREGERYRQATAPITFPRVGKTFKISREINVGGKRLVVNGGDQRTGEPAKRPTIGKHTMFGRGTSHRRLGKERLGKDSSSKNQKEREGSTENGLRQGRGLFGDRREGDWMT